MITNSTNMNNFISDKNVQCSVCMEDFKFDESVRKLPCSHHYHNDCIVPWLELVSKGNVALRGHSLICVIDNREVYGE